MNEGFPINLEERYRQVCKRISSLAPDRNVRLIAVSKSQSVDAIEQLYHLGQRDFGENYVQEMLEKAEQLGQRGCSEIRWHFIGHLQTNKVKTLLPHVYCIHTLDSERLVQEVSKRWTSLKKGEKLPVFIEVNVDRESTKSGVDPSQVPAFAQSLKNFPTLSIQGLMAVPNPSLDPQRRFRELADLKEVCGSDTAGFLSMGMSNDFEAALREGATHIRLGTVLFGKRNV